MATTFILNPSGILCIQVVDGHEHGTFYLREGFVRNDPRVGEDRYWAELLVSSTFGVVGYRWDHMGKPAVGFFTEANLPYFKDKLWGNREKVFDATTARRSARTLLEELFEDGTITDDEAQQAESALRGISDECEWYMAVAGNAVLCEHVPPAGLNTKAENPQCTGMFEHLWPGFVEGLRRAHTPGYVAVTDT